MVIIISILLIIIIYIIGFRTDPDVTETFEKNNCRLPTENNPFSNSLYTDYLKDNIKACDTPESNELQQKLFHININKNNESIESNIKLNDYYFYTLPNTYNISNQKNVGEWLFLNDGKTGECKRLNKNCHLIK